MAYLIFTYRPFDDLVETKFMPQFNRTARRVQKSPEDHTAYLNKGFVYESVFPEGVRKISYVEWLEKRPGSTIWLYEVDENRFDLEVFYRMEGLPYDVRANVGWLLNIKWLLTHKPENGIYCSELMAAMQHKKDPELWMPKDICNDVAELTGGKNQMLRIAS